MLLDELTIIIIQELGERFKKSYTRAWRQLYKDLEKNPKSQTTKKKLILVTFLDISTVLVSCCFESEYINY